MIDAEFWDDDRPSWFCPCCSLWIPAGVTVCPRFRAKQDKEALELGNELARDPKAAEEKLAKWLERL